MCHRSLKQFLPACVVCLWAIVVAGSGPLSAQKLPSSSIATDNRVSSTANNSNSSSLTTIFKYSNFSDVSGLTFNGTARQAGVNLLLSPVTPNQIASVWYDNQVNVGQGFSTSFTLDIVPSSSSFTTADGMAFVIQNQGLSALGDLTGQPGYEGIFDSVAVEFDTFMNDQFSDPNNNHVAVQSCGVAANSLDHGSRCDLGLQANLPITLADGSPHKYLIRYSPGSAGAPGKFTVGIDGQTVLALRLNLDTLLSLNGNDAWVGFTGGTGSAFEAQVVKNWVFASVGTETSLSAEHKRCRLRGKSC